jgi:hypothetical protein
MNVNVVFEEAGIALSEALLSVKTLRSCRGLPHVCGRTSDKEEDRLASPAGVSPYLGGSVCGPSMGGYGVRKEGLIVTNYTMAATVKIHGLI